MLERRALILAKLEPINYYGIDSVPTVAANALLTGVPTIEIIEANKTREMVLPYFGKLANINIGEGVKISFQTEMRGSGATPPTTPPRIGALLRACGLTETITPSTGPVEYDENSTQDGESVTLYLYNDGILYKALGCIGNSVKIACKSNAIVTFDFEFTGLWGGKASITDDTHTAPTFGDASVPPVFRSAAFLIDTYAAIIDALEINVANTVIKRASANASGGVLRYSITDREVSGSCDPEIVTLTGSGAYNPWEDADESTPGEVTATVGTTAGNRLVLTLPNVLKSYPKLGAREGIRTYAISFVANPTLIAGNNRIQLRFN